MTAIRTVYVRKPSEDAGLFFVCEPREFGWICGRCRRGNLGFAPKKSDKCKVCKAKVCQVITLHDYVVGENP